MSFSIDAPFSYFVNSDGDALESGYIYFGVAGLSAETNPVTVYWDAALTIPAAQPIRTRAGLPYRNGSPASIFSGSSVSVTVKDKNGAMVYNSPSNYSLADSDGASRIGNSGGGTVQEAIAVKGGSVAVAGGNAAINYKWELGANAAEGIGGIWADKTYFTYAISQTFTAANSPVTVPATSPAATAFFYANAAGAQGDICASMHVSFARASNTTVFGANIIAGAVGGLTNVKIVGLEIDVEPSVGVVPAAGSGGVYINAFNEPCPGPAIMIGGVGSGTFNNGLVLGGLASTAAGVALESSATANSLINTTVGTFSETAVLLGNEKSRGIQLRGTASAHAFIYNDSSNNVRSVLGSGGWVWRDNADVVSLVSLDAGGNFNLQAGGTIFFANSLSTTSAVAGVNTLPTNPVGFLTVKIGGTDRKIPYYAT